MKSLFLVLLLLLLPGCYPFTPKAVEVAQDVEELVEDVVETIADVNDVMKEG